MKNPAVVDVMPKHHDQHTDALLRQIAAAGLLPPVALTVAITTACNLYCEHCWVDCHRNDHLPHRVGLKSFRKLLEDFTALGGQEVCITGGEPMTHPAWCEIVSACCEHPQINKVTLQTNGTLLASHDLKRFCGERFHKLFFQVSLDGCSPATHDLIRGAGSLTMAMNGLRFLADAGFGSQTTIAFTEMRHNFEEIPQLLEIADHLGVASVIGLPLVKSGGAELNDVTQLPTKEQYLALLDRFGRDETFRNRYEKIGCFAAIAWLKGLPASVHTGCRFLERPYVTASGLLFPCPLLQVNGFAGRGMYQRSLSEVILESLPVWSDLMQVSQARASGMACIENCAGGLHCGGGCLARAYLPGRNLLAREDRCELRKAVYAWNAQRKYPGEW